jgi:hypothetical protein
VIRHQHVAIRLVFAFAVLPGRIIAFDGIASPRALRALSIPAIGKPLAFEHADAPTATSIPA